ncbi:hypothetical protein K432DRAFT_330749 [Lepidopterella palustris CBS 459.81]|uniref:C2H2-type domain-containing protein n=1 Tax=Lepidopterella palustris CBS 459.81 TaxID=1314670 RepID=A0A8E2E817_9PEZI|nr:hypothetical protein K432DRAFT_330749 [Lepidopterella palustris CBS 459.81]
MPPFEQSVTVSGYHNLSYPQTPVGTSAYLAQDTESSPLEETPNILRPPSSHSATSQGEDKKGSRSRSNSPGKQKQTYACDLPNCTSTAQFTRLADLQRHQSTVHNTEKPFPCNISGCNRVGSRGFNRRDHLTEHQRSFHQIEIPKRRPGQRTARQTYQINSPNDQH